MSWRQEIMMVNVGTLHLPDLSGTNQLQVEWMEISDGGGGKFRVDSFR